MGNTIWLFFPLALMVVVAIIVFVVAVIKSEIKNYGIECTLFVIFLILAFISGVIGLYILSK